MTEAEQAAQAMRWGAKGLCESCGGAGRGPTGGPPHLAHMCLMCALYTELGNQPPIQDMTPQKLGVAVSEAFAVIESWGEVPS